MRKILFSAMACLAMNFASAQEVSFQKGDFLLGGSIGFGTDTKENTITLGSVTTTSKVTTTTTKVSPELLYFFNEKTAVGGALDIQSTSVSGSDAVTTFGAKALLRRYFLEAKGFKVYGQAGLGFGSAKNTTTFGLEAGLGVNYFVTPKWAINFALADVFRFQNTSYKGGSSATEFGLNINRFNNPFAVATFGLSYKF